MPTNKIKFSWWEVLLMILGIVIIIWMEGKL